MKLISIETTVYEFDIVLNNMKLLISRSEGDQKAELIKRYNRMCDIQDELIELVAEFPEQEEYNEFPELGGL